MSPHTILGLIGFASLVGILSTCISFTFVSSPTCLLQCSMGSVVRMRYPPFMMLLRLCDSGVKRQGLWLWINDMACCYPHVDTITASEGVPIY
jgi:hypothetical protein